MSLFEDTNPRDLKELLSQIHSRELALPDFQRDFVWDPNMTQELIVSIASNYPAGSLLRIRNTHNLFACRHFADAPELNGHKPMFLVLDGQQRLTSLYQAFYGVGEHRYFLHLQRLMNGDDIEECIFHLRANSKKAKEYERLDVQADELVLPLSVLKNGLGGFYEWVMAVADAMSSPIQQAQLQAVRKTIADQWIKVIDSYAFPVVTLSDTTSAEAVCTIFETLNRTGVKLSPFELLTARFWPQGINLRQLWDKAQDDYPIITDFEIDPYYILQIIALIARPTPSCKRGAVLDLDATTINEWWGRAIAGLARGLTLLRDDCGVIHPRWLPYNTIVVPLAAVLAKSGPTGSPEDGANRQKLARWFWCSVFGQTYEFGSNSQAERDTVELLGWLKGGAAPMSVSAFKFDPQLLADTTVRQRALYRGTICLILRRGPRDFHNGEKITGDLMIKQNIDDHHVFPAAYLNEQGVASPRRDCVLNRTLIDRATNRRIGKRAPSDYLTEMRSSLDSDKPGSFRQLLESHLLPADDGSPLWRDDFDAFLEWRQQVIWQEIAQVTGLPPGTVKVPQP